MCYPISQMIMCAVTSDNSKLEEFASIDKKRFNRFALGVDCALYSVLVIMGSLALSGILSSPISLALLGAATGVGAMGLLIEGSMIIRLVKDHYSKDDELEGFIGEKVIESR